MAKIEPAVETLTFDLGNTVVATAAPGSTPGHSTYYVDISQSASLANRKFFRQGLQWALKGIRVNSQSVAPSTEEPQPGSPRGGVIISKLPQNWTMSNSWEKGMRTWLRMNNEALEEAESLRPRFLDFKIYMDAKHHDLGYAANKRPVVTNYVSYVGNMIPATAGEWEPSSIQIPQAYNSSIVPGVPLMQEFEIIAVGANFPGLSAATGLNAVSLIEGYAASRSLPNDLEPNTPTDAGDIGGPSPENWLSAIFNEGTTQTSNVVDDLISENNRPPYPFEGDGFNVDTMYPGGQNQLSGPQIHCIEPITGSTVGGVTYIKGGTFPCGLIRIDIYNNDDLLEMNTQLQIDLVPGTHRGYLAENMTEM